MPRISPAPVERARPAIVDNDLIEAEEHQWWMRIIFVAISVVFATLMINVLSSFATLQDFLGALLISLFSLIAAFFAVLASPIRFQDRYMRPILIYGAILEIITNTLIMLK
ncbi:hypothetical protein [Comamonas sp. 26]|uniref:hypothetical protein n=1 Tax=Comamonas sp. 26 TaxID=2035201 RepID=UPI000C601AC9|nr:hypothetical protein [Comamonas sp. 26]PIG07757.1 hypothetical protein CLU84_0583 [Comamonas sp. 26]